MSSLNVPTSGRGDGASGRGHPSSSATFRQILHSTAWIGGSSMLVLALSLFRMKALAVLVGPSGVGLFGLYNALVDMCVAIAGMGVQSSGVREVAHATGNDEPGRMAAIVTALRWGSVALGVLGGLVLLVAAAPLAFVTFGDAERAAAVAVLGAAVLVRIMLGAELALIQGLRQIRILAHVNVLGAAIGSLAAVVLVWIFGMEGLAPALVAMALSAFLVSMHYRQRVAPAPTPAPSPLSPEARRAAAALLRLGAVFMISGALTMGAAYVIRIIVLHASGVQAAGLYQAAWAVASLYTTFVLQAMSADFYPRLTTVAGDNAACNRLVNEQAEISILLATPGVLATIALAPLVITIFYSTEFVGAVTLLRWLCLGMILRVVAWPMGFIVLAKGAQRAFFWTEVAATAVHVGMAALLVPVMGPDGAGAAFFILYAWHGALIYVVVRRLSNFRWSTRNRTLAVASVGAALLAFAISQVLPPWPTVGLVLPLAAASGIFSLRSLGQLFSPPPLPGWALPWLPRLIGWSQPS
ncbi:O-antigen translocase [Lutibaculum baratangense]|uniref:Uncharacterized protein n=1 Tax=Lutibaculum baratangense AMV1 TaxID=631454 RepID=V4RIE1_9HYPH|nr:O-antigen translocase [Lutibaculum baratangense]ESR23050.1 hypothetical protein N177_3118 [Lutibaculum baratangense AMV1]